MNGPVFWSIQIVLIAAYGLSYLLAPQPVQQQIRDEVLGANSVPEIPIDRVEPIQIELFYDRPEMVSNEDLAAVLWQIRPKFPRAGLRPNLVEHAIRVWSVKAEFPEDADVLSGEQMQAFLLDHATFLQSWDTTATPLLEERPTGVGVNWGEYRSASVHHDHLLACITEAGARLDAPVFLASQRQLTLEDVLRESLRDFRYDERETEWTAMAFGLWLPPVKSWQAADGRTISFDMLAQRLIRGYLEKGVCSGTHRVYSLMLLWRIDQQYDILSADMEKKVYLHLASIRDQITESQFEDGHWPSNWNMGKQAVTTPKADELKDAVIATGHHLEWLAIAPEELHPPRKQIEKAARWIIETTKAQPAEKIFERYTFFSHVGNALAYWRKTYPSHFWSDWIGQHPDYQFQPTENVTDQKQHQDQASDS